MVTDGNNGDWEVYINAYNGVRMYRGFQTEPQVYMYETEIKKFGKKNDDSTLTIKFKDFYKYPEIVNSIIDNEGMNLVEFSNTNQITEEIYQTELVNKSMMFVMAAVGIAISNITYYAIFTVTDIVLNYDFIIDIQTVIIVDCAVVVYNMLSMYFPMKKVLKQDIIALIKG